MSSGVTLCLNSLADGRLTGPEAEAEVEHHLQTTVSDGQGRILVRLQINGLMDPLCDGWSTARKHDSQKNTGQVPRRK